MFHKEMRIGAKQRWKILLGASEQTNGAIRIWRSKDEGKGMCILISRACMPLRKEENNLHFSSLATLDIFGETVRARDPDVDLAFAHKMAKRD